MASKKLGYVCYVIMPDRGPVPLENLTAEEREQWAENKRRRLSENMSAYYSQHPEEYTAL